VQEFGCVDDAVAAMQGLLPDHVPGHPPGNIYYTYATPFRPSGGRSGDWICDVCQASNFAR
jgi:hypothetical protein